MSNSPSSNRPISLLSLLSQIFKKVLLKRLETDTNIDDFLPIYLFVWILKKSLHFTHEVIRSLLKKKFSTTAFLDIEQFLYKVWHQGRPYELKLALTTFNYLILKSYLSERYIQTKYELKLFQIMYCAPSCISSIYQLQTTLPLLNLKTILLFSQSM